jgi:hypothetical protein
MSAHGKRPGDLGTVDAAPPRLIEDAATSALVRQDLANVASAAPSYDAAAGLLALQAAIGTGATVAAGASGTGGATALKTALGLKLKLAIAGGVGAVAIASAVVVIQPPRGEAPVSPRRVPSAQQQPSRSAVHAVPAAVAPDAPSVVPAPIEPATQPDQAPTAVSPAQHDRAAAEIALLAQIKAVIDRAPARALRLAEQGQRRFGHGYLHHEREGLAIVALQALGRRDEAQARASAYLARYPHSPMSDRVRALIVQGATP